jgi:beta-glucanase (GH16 family)
MLYLENKRRKNINKGVKYSMRVKKQFFCFNSLIMKTSMQNKPFLLIICLVIFLFSCNKKENVTNNTDKYKLVWSDEFNVDGRPDPTKWIFEEGFVRNQEFQWYQANNARCENGLLIIEVKRERKQNPFFEPGSDDWKRNRKVAEYTSSSLLTRGLHSWMFGRFEMRGKIDTRPGLWPAFWTLGINGSWPHNGEVDIMEYYGGKLLANIAWGAQEKWQAVWDTYSLPIAGLIENDPDWSNKFHIWKMDWDEESIRLYLDDILLNMVYLSTTFNRDQEGKNPFLQPHYIIVNLAIGGTAGGDPSKTIFPALYEIDYIRVYQK